jgi:hypothetical protein
MAMTMKNAVFLDTVTSESCQNRRFEGTRHKRENQRTGKNFITANVIPLSLTLSTLEMEEICSSVGSNKTYTAPRPSCRQSVLT